MGVATSEREIAHNFRYISASASTKTAAVAASTQTSCSATASLDSQHAQRPITAKAIEARRKRADLTYHELIASTGIATFDVMAGSFLHGTVHEADEDLQRAIRANPEASELWKSLTPLGRNEFICWVADAKQAKTRKRRIERTCEELLEGKKRPCCWAGCIHRTDKAPSPWQQAVLIEKRMKK
jgi:Bacteriocin-protection, YdeI or OmpD-Associated